jgi:hypothetical protein
VESYDTEMNIMTTAVGGEGWTDAKMHDMFDSGRYIPLPPIDFGCNMYHQPLLHRQNTMKNAPIL